jgi:hypothetical protein
VVKEEIIEKARQGDRDALIEWTRQTDAYKQDPEPFDFLLDEAEGGDDSACACHDIAGKLTGDPTAASLIHIWAIDAAANKPLSLTARIESYFMVILFLLIFLLFMVLNTFLFMQQSGTYYVLNHTGRQVVGRVTGFEYKYGAVSCYGSLGCMWGVAPGMLKCPQVSYHDDKQEKQKITVCAYFRNGYRLGDPVSILYSPQSGQSVVDNASLAFVTLLLGLMNAYGVLQTLSGLLVICRLIRGRKVPLKAIG